MMRARLTYLPLEVAEQFDDFIIVKDEQIHNAIRARTRDFSTLSLLKLLYQLRASPASFSELYTKSMIRMKQSFINYLRFCISYNFVSKKESGGITTYSITEKGRVMLNLFLQNEHTD